ncbi:MAG TPA: ABC transporter permease [Methanocella sp.]|uniref:ABC transporter permease n=1 Tax=Methanocella sp. TaxID=2052833 RepID=UPI002D04EF96|nr:ABC transporter permease [Methanocella sp.]HTY91424.1 ABC transporter permease [Methanocella sp.]
MAVDTKAILEKPVEKPSEPPKKKGFIDEWKEKHESRIKEFRYSFHMFSRSPLAIVGLLTVLVFLLIMIFAPYIAPYGPMDWDWNHMKEAPSLQHLFGTDDRGADVFSRVIWGSRLSMPVGFAVVISAVIVGTIIGIISGYYGGAVDELMMRITDIFLSFPYLVLAMVVCAALGRSLENVMFAMTITWWPSYARLVRGQVLSIRENKYVEAARALGASNTRIMFRHILPNSISPIIVQATMDVGGAILTAAGLSFIGFGAKPGQAEWGRMVSDGSNYFFGQWWIATFPGLVILLITLGFNLFGDGLRDILDPKLRR